MMGSSPGVPPTCRSENRPSDPPACHGASSRGKRLDIRSWFLDETGEWKPTQKGVSLTQNEAIVLREALGQALESIGNPTDAPPAAGEQSLEGGPEFASGRSKALSPVRAWAQRPPALLSIRRAGRQVRRA